MARSLTTEEAQNQLNNKFPNAHLTLIEFSGVNKPCEIMDVNGNIAPFARFSNLLAYKNQEALQHALLVQHRKTQAPEVAANPLTEILEIINSDWCKVPFYPDIKFIGGDGEFGASDEYYEPSYTDFDRQILRARQINPNHVVCFNLWGDSLSPLIRHGATLALDTNQNDHIIDGKVYAFIHDGMRRVKILHKDSDDRVRIESANPKYASEVVRRSDIRLIGRVFWYSQEI